MKKAVLAVITSIGAATTALAGTLAPAVMETDVIVADMAPEAHGSSGAGLIIPLILIALIAAALSSK